MAEEKIMEPKLTPSISDEAAPSTSGNMESYCSPALLNEIVLDGVFQFLGMEDIHTSRLVCQRWNAVVESAIRKRFIVTLTPTGDNSLTAFKAVFQNELPVESLRLLNGIHPPGLWRVPQLGEVFEHWENHLKHLEMNIRFADRRFSRFELLPMTQCNLSTLLLANGSFNTSIKISIDHLKNIKIISLAQNIVMDIGVQGSKIAPEEIALQGITFHSNRMMLDEVILNNFIDFHKAQKIMVVHPRPERTEKVCLDMTQSIKVEFLELIGVEILGGSQAKWNINGDFKLDGIPWKQKTEMIFKSLNFKNAEIDICKLPATIERLEMEYSAPVHDELVVFSSEPPVLNNLVYLSLDEHRSRRNRSCLHVFKSCTSLRALYVMMPPPIARLQQQLPLLNIYALPPSIRRLEIEGMHGFMGGEPHNLEMLILKDWHLNQNVLIEIRRRLVSKRIVIDTSSWGVVTRNFFTGYLEVIGAFQRTNSIDFWLGPITFAGSSPKYYYKDHIGEQTGRNTPEVISEEEFQDIRQLFKME